MCFDTITCNQNVVKKLNYALKRGDIQLDIAKDIKTR